MAPEMVVMLSQASYEKTGYTCAVDWWSLGVTMFKLLTGYRPFTDDNFNTFVEMATTMNNLVREHCDSPEYAILFQEIPFPPFITPKAVVTTSTEDGDLVYVIRASQINDREMMDKVTVEQVCDFFLYAKEVHNIVANRRSASTGRMCSVIFANDISGVRRAPDSRFSKALTSSSDQYESLYPSLAGPTMILNLPLILQAFVGLLKPLFPKSVQERLVFKRAPVLASLVELTPLGTDPTVRRNFVREIKGLLP